MAEDQRVAEVLLRFKVAQQDLQAARQGFANLRSDVDQLQKRTLTSADAQKKLNVELEKLARQRAVDQIGRNFQTRINETNDWRKALELVNQQLVDIGASDGEIARVTAQIVRQTEALEAARRGGTAGGIKTAADQQGDLSTGLSSISSLVGGNQVLSLGADLSGVLEYLPRVKEAIAGIPEAAKATYETIGKGGVGLIGAVGALTLALALSAEQFNKTKQAASADLDAREAALRLIQSGTQEEIQARIESLRRNKAINQQIADDAESTLTALRQGITDQLGPAALGLAELGSSLGIGAGELAAAKDNASAAAAALNETNTELSLLEQYASAGASTTNDLAAAQERLNAAQVTAIQDQIDQQTQINRLFRTGTAEGIREQIAANLDEQAAIAANIIKLQELASTSEDAQKAFDQAQARLHELSVETGRLQTEVLPLVEARERETQAIEDQEAKLKSLASVTEKYNNDVKAIEDRANEARANAQQKYNDALVKAAEVAVEAAENALSKLRERQATLAQEIAREGENVQRKAAFDQLNALIKFQEDEAKASRDHLRNLQRIKDDAAAAEEDAAFNRDFAALFDIRRNTGRQLREASSQYEAEQRERQIAFQQQNAEAARQYEFERQQRQIKYQQDLIDAQAQYQRELQQAAANRQKALQTANTAYRNELLQLQSKLTAELTAKRAAAIQELQLISQTEQQRVQIMAQAQAALVQQAYALKNMFGGSGTGKGSYKPTSMAYGGQLMAGQPAVVNDRFPGQREGFNGVPFPPGLGLFIPATAGTVNSGGGNPVTINMPIYAAQGQSEAEIAAIAERKIVAVLEGIYS